MNKSSNGELDSGDTNDSTYSILSVLALIDDQLGVVLSNALKQNGATKDAEWLLDRQAGNRPLGTLAVRRMARCLGLIDEPMRKTIDALRGLRNKYATGRTPGLRLTDEIVRPVFETLPPYRSHYVANSELHLTTCWKGLIPPARRMLLIIMLGVLAQIQGGRRVPPGPAMDPSRSKSIQRARFRKSRSS